MYRIMIVEDDEGIARGVSQLITAWGMEAVVVQNFQNVAGEFAQTNPQLVLMDIGLPFMNGYHWCSEIRRVSQVPIIFLSSASDNMNIIMAMNMGADDFIPKPFDGNVLIAKIQALLRRTYSFGESSPVLEHRGQFPVLPGAEHQPEQKRVSDSPGADEKQGQGGQPGKADGSAVADGLLRG